MCILGPLTNARLTVDFHEAYFSGAILSEKISDSLTWDTTKKKSPFFLAACFPPSPKFVGALKNWIPTKNDSFELQVCPFQAIDFGRTEDAKLGKVSWRFSVRFRSGFSKDFRQR